MNKKIIYKNEDGGISIIHPSPEFLQTHTIEEVALKDVPEGFEYEIIDEEEIPSDRTFRDAWEWLE
jgi:hypothetical protein